MSPDDKSISDLISSVDQSEAPEAPVGVDLPEGKQSKYQGQKKSKAFPIIVGILFLLILGVGGYYVYTNYIQGDGELPIGDEDTVEKEYLLTEYKAVELDTLISGEIEEDSGRCISDECIADVTVIYDFGTPKEISLESVSFSSKFQSLNRVLSNFVQPTTDYYLLRYGSGNASGTYLFNEAGYVSDSFCSVSSTPESSIMVDSNYLIFEDCGIVGQEVELLSGVSVLELSTNEITQIAKPSTENGDTSYTIERINKANGELYLSECVIGEDLTQNCEEKMIDLVEVYQSE